MLAGRDDYERYLERCNEHALDLAEWVADRVTINGRPTDRDDYESGLAAFFGDVPDLRWDLRHLVVGDAALAARLIDTGTATDGTRLEFVEFAIYRLEAGLIAEVWGNLSREALLAAAVDPDRRR